MRGSRLSEMEKYVMDHNAVSLEELCKVFGISINTVRRDVAELVSGGGIEKIHGGVAVKKNMMMIPFEQRSYSNKEGKERIGRLAARLVQNNDVIFVDSGSTTQCMVEHLAGHTGVAMLTNNLNAIINAYQCPELNVICMSGRLVRQTNSFMSNRAVRILEEYNITKAFMGVTGISYNGGDITNSYMVEFDIKKKAVDASKEVYLLADHSKFGRSALLTYSKLTEITGIVTDRKPDNELMRIFIANNIAVYYE